MDIDRLKRVCNREPLNRHAYFALVKQGETVTQGGIVMPEAVEFTERYKVIRAAKDCTLVREGDEVILRGTGHHEDIIEGYSFTVAQESAVIAVVTDIRVEEASA